MACTDFGCTAVIVQRLAQTIQALTDAHLDLRWMSTIEIRTTPKETFREYP